MPVFCGQIASETVPRTPRTPVFAEPTEDLQVAAFCSLTNDFMTQVFTLDYVHERDQPFDHAKAPF